VGQPQELCEMDLDLNVCVKEEYLGLGEVYIHTRSITEKVNQRVDSNSFSNYGESHQEDIC